MMLPVGFEQEDQKQDGTASPCQRIGPGNHLKDREESECCGDVDDTQAAPEKQHSSHWYNSIAAASHHTGRAMGKGQQEEKQADNVSVNSAVGNGFLCTAENLQCIWNKKVDQKSGNLSGDHAK